jgi:hypothetical protein
MEVRRRDVGVPAGDGLGPAGVRGLLVRIERMRVVWLEHHNRREQTILPRDIEADEYRK